MRYHSDVSAMFGMFINVLRACAPITGTLKHQQFYKHNMRSGLFDDAQTVAKTGRVEVSAAFDNVVLGVL